MRVASICAVLLSNSTESRLEVAAPAVAQTLVVTNAMLQSGTQHNYPAPLAILSCMYEGAQLPIETALRLEAKYMARLLADPVSGNMLRTLFWMIWYPLAFWMISTFTAVAAWLAHRLLQRRMVS